MSCNRAVTSLIHYFVILDGSMWTLISEHFTKRTTFRPARSVIADVYDGSEYKKHTHLREVGHLSFILNTDGVAIFRSSKKSMWPVWLVLNELPPAERYIHVCLYMPFVV